MKTLIGAESSISDNLMPKVPRSRAPDDPIWETMQFCSHKHTCVTAANLVNLQVEASYGRFKVEFYPVITLPKTKCSVERITNCEPDI